MTRVKDVSALGKKLHQKTWAGKFWGMTGAIRLAQKMARTLIFERGTLGEKEGLSMLSSTYYAAAGNASGHQGPIWLFRKNWCGFRAVWLSDRLEKLCGGKNNMMASWLDVRASILRKAGREEEARSCIMVALSPDLKIPKETRALLFASLARDKGLNLRERMVILHSLKGLAAEIREGTVLVRLYRAIAEVMKEFHMSDYRLFVYKAEEIAHKDFLHDQELKLRVVFPELYSSKTV